ncbi:MAG: pyridoxal phosphate-dependent aminotransferase [Paludibacteraceae bacterium]|nr:pyridoxal phosphate-dependent aminotransferase [Paludibacteraceae bacterium]
MQVSNRILKIEASQSLVMAARAKAMKAAGVDVVSMSLGEPDMDTPKHVRLAAQDAVDNHWSHYGPVAGIPALREAVANYQNGVTGNAIPWIADNVLVSAGAKMAIYNAIQTAINPGDEVVIPMPSWVSYSEMVKLAEGVVVPVETKFEDRYCLTPEQLRAALTKKTRMVILCSPNNPTGSVYTASELEALVAVLRDFPEVYILADEIYNELIYNQSQKAGGDSPISLSYFSDLAERLIIINGVSKAYAMTGYRIGWLMSKNEAFVSACIRLQGQQVTCATMVAQKAAEAALSGNQDCVAEMRNIFASRRKLICELAAAIPGLKFHKPEGAFYLFPDVSAWGTGDEVAERLLDEAHVAVVSGSAFGCPSCIRLSYAISEDEIRKAMSRIANLLNNY